MKMKARRLRKCSVCKSTEHRADYHGSARERADQAAQAGAQPLPPEIAMRSMIDPSYAMYLITDGTIGQALANCTIALNEARQAGIGNVSDSMLTALATLEKKARALSPEQIARLRELRRKREEADVAYAVEAAQMAALLGYPVRK